MSTRETLLAAVATALSGVAGGRIYRSRREQLPTLPAVIVEPQGEEAQEVSLGYMDRRITVGVVVYAKGDTPDNAADSTLASAFAALAATPSLGLGEDVQLETTHAVEWDFEDYDYVRATLRLTYFYRTASGSM
jgi:hypothetical protein